MKARVKATGEVVDVDYLVSVSNDNGIPVKSFLETDEIEILGEPNDTTDWEAYHREVAKECMAAMLDKGIKNWGSDTKTLADWAVQAADALIARLREQKGGEE